MKRLVLIAGLSVGLLGCNVIKEKLAAKATEKAVETSTGGDVKVNTGAGSFTGSAKLPDGWPTSVPVYPGAKITTSMGTPQGKTAILETSDSVPAAVTFYRKELSSMKLQADLDMGGSHVLTFQKDKQNVSITISPSGGKTSITLSVSGY